MKARTLLAVSAATISLMWFQPSNRAVSTAQTRAYQEVHMPNGVIDKGPTLTGFFSRSAITDPSWSVFIGANGQVYKLLLADKKVAGLYIDGQKIEDGQIEKHAAAYRPLVEKLLRSQEIENELRELELQMRPTERKIEALDDEMLKLDEREEKLEKARVRNSAGNDQELSDIRAQQKKLAEMISERAQEIEGLSVRVEDLNNKNLALDLANEQVKVMRRIAEDLRSFGLIKGTSNLSFKLSNIELIVNGKRPAPEVYEKLKAKYIFDVGTESGFVYNWKWKD